MVHRITVSLWLALASLVLSACNLNVKIEGSGNVQSVSGVINCGSDEVACTTQSTELQNITELLNAEPAPGYKFFGWEGVCSGRSACAVEVGQLSGNKTATAVFIPIETIPLRAQSNPNEYVALNSEMVIDSVDDFTAIAEPLFGETARSGSYLAVLEVEPGLFLQSDAFPGNPDQAVITASMRASIDTDPVDRTLLQVPASFDYGALFIETAKVALTKMFTLQVEHPGDVEPYHLEYRVYSAKGGAFTFGVVFDGVITKVVLNFRSPTTSLLSDQVNMPATDGKPFETIYGMVNFSLSRDQFDFFVERAYGLSAGKNQNFKDFQLLPHDWLRLTVEPDIDNLLINVGFEVVTLDGSRVAISQAPASMVVGEQFKNSVFRKVDNMLEQEASQPGSSLPWKVPFVYSDPDGSGVVEVVAQGVNGGFEIAYAIESPTNLLQDVDFVPYQGTVEVPPEQGEVVCDSLTVEEPNGKFIATFAASSTVKNSKNLDGPLMGNIWGSVFHDNDVTIAGPKNGAVAVIDFHFENVDISGDDGSPLSYLLDQELMQGKYQILGYMDIDGNADIDAPHPDKHDPVMIPIGGFDLVCIQQPIVAEFAILNP